MHRNIAALALIVACAAVVLAQEVGTEHDRNFDFSKIQTFAVKVTASSNDPSVENNAKEAITRRLMEKGWKPADESSCDALVVAHFVSKGKDTMRAFYEDQPTMKWQNVGAPKLADSDDYEYKPGTFVVDIFDAKTRRVIFRGVGPNGSSKNADDPARLDKEAKKMFKSLPASSKTEKGTSANQQP